MFSQIHGLLIFILMILFSKYCSDAATSDDVLTYFNDNEETTGYISAEGKSIQGNGISFCTWIKNPGGFVHIFQAKNLEANKAAFRVMIWSEKNELYGIQGYAEQGDSVEGVKDCNLINFKSWFHICVALNKCSVNFYLNGSPVKNYVKRDNFSLEKEENLSIQIGDVFRYGEHGSLFQSNVFDREVTPQEAKEMYNCKFIAGDIVKWTDITSKSKDIKFGSKIVLKKDDVPCPDPPPYNPTQCPTEEYVQKPEGSDLCSTSGTMAQGSSSGNTDPESNAGSSDIGSSSGSSDPGSSSESSDPGSSSESSDPGSSLGSSDPGSSLGSSDPGSSSGNGGPGVNLQ